MVEEQVYVPPFESRAGADTYAEAMRVQFNPNLRPKAEPSKLGTSLDHLALIDETLISDAHAKPRPGQLDTLRTLDEAANSPSRWKRARKIHGCRTTNVIVAPKPIADEASFTHAGFINRTRTTIVNDELVTTTTPVWTEHYARHTVENGGAVMPLACHCRACPMCAAKRRRTLRKQFTERTKAMARPKLLTLTLVHSSEPLRTQAAKAKEAFRRLRSHAVWKQQCSGGFWVLEIKPSKNGEGFHVHIHAILDSVYIPQDWISKRWHKITGDSLIVDIRQISPKRAAYLAKYVAKGSELTHDGEALWSYHEAFHRARDTNKFGVCQDSPTTPSHLCYLGTVRGIIARARSGDPTAAWLLPLVETLLVRSIVERERPPDE